MKLNHHLHALLIRQPVDLIIFLLQRILATRQSNPHTPPRITRTTQRVMHITPARPHLDTPTTQSLMGTQTHMRLLRPLRPLLLRNYPNQRALRTTIRLLHRQPHHIIQFPRHPTPFLFCYKL